MMKKIGFLAAVLSLLVSASAVAQQPEGTLQAAVDLHPVIGLDGPSGVGFGFDVRGGYGMPMEGFTLVPEAVIGWNSFGGGEDVPGMDVSMSMFRMMAGARAVFEMDKLFPAAFAHFGYGSVSSTVTTDLPILGKTSMSSSSGTGLFELGGALDYALDENLLLGGHAGMNFMTATGGGSFLNIGATASYRF